MSRTWLKRIEELVTRKICRGNEATNLKAWKKWINHNAAYSFASHSC